MPRKRKIDEDVKCDLGDLKGIGPESEEQLKAYGIYTIAELAQTPEILLRTGGVKVKGAETILANAREFMRLNKPILATDMKPKWKLSTGVEALDKMLHGGIESQVISEFFGEYASGKSQCCQTLAAKAIEAGGFVIYVDTENQIRPERLQQIFTARELPEDSLKKIYIAQTINSDHQINLIRYEVPAICRKKPVKLLVVDSIMSHFSAEYIGRGQLAERQQTLNQHIFDMLRQARAYDFPVAIANQVRAVPNALPMYGPLSTMQAAGGHIISHSSSVRLFLRKGQQSKFGNRVATLVDSSSIPYGEAPFRISEKGIEAFALEKKSKEEGENNE